MLENFNDGALYAAFSNILNETTGLGTAKDKSVYNEIGSFVRILMDHEITALYRTSKLITKVVESLPTEACEVDYEFTFDSDAVESKEICKVLDSFNLHDLLLDRYINARLYGDSYLVIDVDDRSTNLDEPINLAKAKVINSLKPLEFYQLLPKHNPQGELINYQLMGSLTKFASSNIQKYQGLGYIHPSRIIRFCGKKLRGYALHSNGYRNDSVLQDLVHSWLNFASSMQLAINMMSDYKVFAYGLKDMAMMIEPDPKTGLPKPGAVETLTQRLQAMRLNMSVNGGIAYDMENESVSWLTSNFSGVSDIIDRAKHVFSSNTGIPHTKLWDEGSQGNTSGRSEEGDWLKALSTFLKHEHKPVVLRLGMLVLHCDNYGFGINPEGLELDIDYQELNPIDDKTKAEIRNIQADVDTKYITAKVLSREEVRISRFENAGDDMQTNLIDGSLEREQLEAQERQAALMPAPDDEDEPIDMDATLEDSANLSDSEFNAIADYNEEDIKSVIQSWDAVKSLLPIVYAEKAKK